MGFLRGRLDQVDHAQGPGQGQRRGERGMDECHGVPSACFRSVRVVYLHYVQYKDVQVCTVEQAGAQGASAGRETRTIAGSLSRDRGWDKSTRL